MRIFAWNLNHRTRAKALPTQLAEALLSLAPDVVTLTEYVSGPGHDPLCVELAEGGLGHQWWTPPQRGFNQVFIAGRVGATLGTLAPPSELAHGAANWLHLRFEAPRFDLLGVRVPIFKSAKETRAYWDWFEGALPSLFPGPAIVIGDLNADPRRRGANGPAHLQRLEAAGWQIPDATGPWSFVSHAGATSRVDHALVSPNLMVTRAAYVASANGHPFAGPGPGYFSDHAPLILDFCLPG